MHTVELLVSRLTATVHTQLCLNLAALSKRDEHRTQKEGVCKPVLRTALTSDQGARLDVMASTNPYPTWNTAYREQMREE